MGRFHLAMDIKNTLVEKVSHVAYGSRLYRWSLASRGCERLLLSPLDLWKGDPEKGRWLVNEGVFSVGGDVLRLHNADWEPKGVGDEWIFHMHGFGWLRDLRALGGNRGRIAARLIIKSWMDRYHGWSERFWEPAILGERIYNWIASYDFFGESASEEFQEKFIDLLSRQARHLARTPGVKRLRGVALLHAIRGLAYSGICLEGRESHLEIALNLLHEELPRQILGDGCHVSRNPSRLVEALQIFTDIKFALMQAGYPCPEEIQYALDRGVPAMRFFRHADRRFALFNGTQEGDESMIQDIIMHSRSRANIPHSLPNGGYEKISMGRAMLIMDTGSSSGSWCCDGGHSAPLAFEFSYGRERVFVNCGTHPTSDQWREALSYAPAHNCLVIDDRDAGREALKVKLEKKEREAGYRRIVASHDGYMYLGGVLHRRSVRIDENGHLLQGEDELTCSIGLGKPHSVVLRFHLHPDMVASMTRDGEEVLLRSSAGVGWRFGVDGGALVLEDSIYLGRGITQRKTKQLVVRTRMDSDMIGIRWFLHQER